MIPRFEIRRLFGLPLLSAGEGADTSPSLESELTFDLTGENPENRLFGRFGPVELRKLLDTSGLLAGLSERGYPDPAVPLPAERTASDNIKG